MTFEDIKNKYPDRDPAFPLNLPEPDADTLNRLIEKYNCKYPKSFIDFQIKYFKEIPIGDFAFEGLGFANNELDLYMSLEEVLKDYRELNYPEYLTPFKQDNGDFWCFDSRDSDSEPPVVIWDHNNNNVETDSDFRWSNFIDWIDRTMNDEI